MEKPLIFISHITAEKKLGLALKKCIEEAFLGMADVFISSDPENLPAGKPWYNTIMEKLEEASILFVLMSPQAIKKPWISYEAGAASIRDIPMIPVCHSGFTLNNLPAPFNFQQAVEAINLESLQLITPTISNALGSGRPSIDFSEFIGEVNNHEQINELLESHGIETDDIQIDTLPDYVKACLFCLGECIADMDTEGVSSHILKESMKSRNYNGTACKLSVNSLELCGLIDHEVIEDGYNTFKSYKLTPSGWKYIEKNLKPEQLLVPVQSQTYLDRFYDSGPDDDVPF